MSATHGTNRSGRGPSPETSAAHHKRRPPPPHTPSTPPPASISTADRASRRHAQMAGGDVFAGLVRELSRHDEGGDACRQGRRREAAEILPAVELCERTLADDELRGGPDHDRERVVVEAARYSQAPGEQDGQRDLVELGRSPVRGTVHEPVLEPRAVAALA